MAHYIIEDAGGEKSCFYAQSDGIYKKTETGCKWNDGKRVYPHPVRDFCVKTDANNILHILCINRQGDIIYIKNNGETHTLIKSNGKISAKHLMLYEYNHRISLVYTAEYGSETLLVYCILGINSMPVTIDSVRSDNFFLYNNKVYYQNKDGILGYKDFSDGKPDTFIPVADNAHSVHIIEYNGQELMVYKAEEGLICGEHEVINDKYAKNPLLIIRGNSLLLVWESGGFIRYAESSDSGETFHTPMRFANSSPPMKIYKIQKGGNFIYEYASEREHEIRLFSGKGEKVSLRRNMSMHSGRETDKVMIMMQMMKSDIAELKGRVEMIEEILKNKEQ